MLRADLKHFSLPDFLCHVSYQDRVSWLACRRCSARTSRAVNIEKNGTPSAAASTAGRPFASSRSTRQTTAATTIPASRAAWIALIVDAPVVQTSSTITTRAPSRKKPSIRRPVPCVFSALRTEIRESAARPAAKSSRWRPKLSRRLPSPHCRQWDPPPLSSRQWLPLLGQEFHVQSGVPARRGPSAAPPQRAAWSCGSRCSNRLSRPKKA